MITDRQHREIDLFPLPKKLHIHGQGRVPRKVDRFSFHPNQETYGRAQHD